MEIEGYLTAGFDIRKKNIVEPCRDVKRPAEALGSVSSASLQVRAFLPWHAMALTFLNVHSYLNLFRLPWPSPCILTAEVSSVVTKGMISAIL